MVALKRALNGTTSAVASASAFRVVFPVRKKIGGTCSQKSSQVFRFIKAFGAQH